MLSRGPLIGTTGDARMVRMGFMDSSIAIRRYHRMVSLDPGRQTADAIARVACWCNRGCTNSSYGFMDSSIAIR